MPTIMYAGKLPKSVEVGQVIVVGGRLRCNASRFDLNLATGPTLADQLALHMSWRLNEGMIVRNTKKMCGWGPEERHENRNHASTDLAVQAGQNFEFHFIVHDGYFEVKIDGLPYCTYNHRMHINQIKAISVERDVEFIRCVSQRSITPCRYPAVTFPTTDKVVFVQDFPSSPQLGHVIMITATPRSETGHFVINLHQGSAKVLAFQILADFNVRSIKFGDRDENGGCDHREIFDNFPFKLDEKFCIAVKFDECQFQVSINGQHYGDFQFTTKNVHTSVSALTIRNFCGMNLSISNVDHVEESCGGICGLNEQSLWQYAR